jgi:membrane protease YdiL (CAAX protease family)
MKAIDLSVTEDKRVVPIVACLLLLLSRLISSNLGTTSLILLAMTYLSVLVICRPEWSPVTLRQSRFPFLVGTLAIVSGRFLLTSTFSWRTTTAGIVLSLVAGVAEEALFRQALFSRIQRYGSPLAVVVSAAVFALVHVPFYGVSALPLDFGAGLLFGWQRSVSGTWIIPASSHALANLLAVIG